MTQQPFAGAPAPVQGVTGGPGLPQGVASVDGSTGNVVITPPNNVIQIRKTDTPQSLQVYEMFHTNTDYNRLALNATLGGPFSIQTEQSGSGVARNLRIRASSALVLGSGGFDVWTINTSGHLVPNTAGASNIGSFGNPVGTTFTNILSITSSTPAGNIYGGTGVPTAGLGANGDYFFRIDTPATALQRIYIRSAGVWVGIV